MVFASVSVPEQLADVADSVERLWLVEGTRPRPPWDLTLLTRFQNLAELRVHGSVRDLRPLSAMQALRDLTLHSPRRQDLAELAPVSGLVALEINLGSVRNVEALTGLPRLAYLELFRVRGVEALEQVASIATVQVLSLSQMKWITALPDFSGAVSLRRLILDTMRGVTDLSTVRSATSLEQIDLIAMGHLSDQALTTLVDHPSLRRASIGLGSDRRNAAAAALLRLPETEPGWAVNERAQLTRVAQ